MELQTEIITIRGIVQGVGFRPTVWRIAKKLGIRGQVQNLGGAVRIVVTDSPSRIEEFLQEIRAGKPRPARIDSIERLPASPAIFPDFQIIESCRTEDDIPLVPADAAVCDDCLAEYFDEGDARYAYGYISCTNCGPRYTIMERLPYDRETTSMDGFEMCELCGGEYRDPQTRRYHAQTVSCHNCGPQPQWRGRAECAAMTAETKAEGGKPAAMASPSQESVHKAIDALANGKIIGLKGVGGYYLACDATDENAVQTLRESKHREQKPFAVLFESLEDVRRYCKVSSVEEAELLSPRRAIVLLEKRPVLDETAVPLAPSVCTSSRFAGAFLPSFALQIELLRAIGKPLVMTSANRTDEPLTTSDKEMFTLMDSMPALAGVLYHTRRIVAGLDDSVTRETDGTIQILRRAKGYAPLPVLARAGIQHEASSNTPPHLFAAGGHLKAVFSLAKGGFIYPSAHLGDMDSLSSETLYAKTFARMKEFFGVEPAAVVCDSHPRYFPTRFAENYAKENDLPLIYSQHHHAHICSVLAEHNITAPAIGVAFDGTGYGDDGAIWGGEILACEGADYERFSHLAYINMNAGDESMREAWKAAAAYLFAMEKYGSEPEPHRTFSIDLSDILRYAKTHKTLAQYESEIAALKTALAARTNTVPSSSMGRLFDAVSALLGICPINRYEGECGSALEATAAAAAAAPAATEQSALALAFHRRVAAAILAECLAARKHYKTSTVCLSGGVFQNKLLIEETLRLLRGEAFSVFYNIYTPPNDGGLSIGQAFIGSLKALGV